jgi:pseudaminic acid cytidylyltransferase
MKIAIIPARGGSKRIIGKNIRSFINEPIIGHTIRNLLESKFFDRVIVSTDDVEIARVSREFGAEVPFNRPTEIADDFTDTNSVIRHAIQNLNLNKNETHYICCVYPTAVLMNLNDLVSAFNLLITKKWNFVFAAYEPNSSPFRSFTRNENGGVKMLFPQNWEKRSQELAKCFVDCGHFYWASSENWLITERIFDEESTFIETPYLRAVDINTEEDWKIAEIVFDYLSQQNNQYSNTKSVHRKFE